MATTAVSGTSTTASTTTGTTSTSAATAAAAASTADQIKAANQKAAQSLLTSLSAGSGVDVASLAQNLVNAEKVPQANAINTKITANDHKKNGYSAVLYVLSQVNTALADLKDTSDYNSLIATGASSSYTLTPSASAKEGDHTIQVKTVYKPQKSLSSATFTDTTSLNQIGAGPFTITKGSAAAVTITPANTSPQALADAINANTTLGITASLVNTGSGFKLLLTGAAGDGNAFAFSDGAASAKVTFPGSNLQDATDASITVDGVSYTRKSNTVTDVISGVTMALRSPTLPSGGVASTDYVSLSRDTAGLKAKFDTLVSNYNDAQTMLAEVSDPKSTIDTYGATLVGDSTVRMVRSKLRNMFSNVSSTPGTNVKYMWQMGFSFDAKGVLSLDSTKLNDALTNNYDDVVKAVTGNQNNLSKYSPTPAGFFGDATYSINQMVSATGSIATQSQNATNQNAKYQEQLTQLDTRMVALLQRYTKQFSSMNSIVGNVNAQKTSLKSTFDGMMASYTNK
jgi:flagellar hook-associated protein 2